MVRGSEENKFVVLDLDWLHAFQGFIFKMKLINWAHYRLKDGIDLYLMGSDNFKGEGFIWKTLGLFRFGLEIVVIQIC